MELTRRNTIIGLGALAGGAGVINATGAFDSVEADRSFEVSVEGDSAALLSLTVEKPEIAGTEEGGAGNSSLIYFTLDNEESGANASAINDGAVTQFFDAFQIQNNGSETVDISMELEDGASGISFVVGSDQLSSLSSDVNLAAENGSAEFGPGEAALVDIQIDTTTEGGYEEPDEAYDITIIANSAAA